MTNKELKRAIKKGAKTVKDLTRRKLYIPNTDIEIKAKREKICITK